jgi:hypothetical protein
MSSTRQCGDWTLMAQCVRRISDPPFRPAAPHATLQPVRPLTVLPSGALLGGYRSAAVAGFPGSASSAFHRGGLDIQTRSDQRPHYPASHGPWLKNRLQFIAKVETTGTRLAYVSDLNVAAAPTRHVRKPLYPRNLIQRHCRRLHTLRLLC